MNKAARRTLEAIFAHPTPADLRWAQIESLVRACGGEVSERAGSRVAFALNGVRAVFHRPHPQPTTGRATVRDVRRFLENARVTPEMEDDHDA